MTLSLIPHEQLVALASFVEKQMPEIVTELTEYKTGQYNEYQYGADAAENFKYVVDVKAEALLKLIGNSAEDHYPLLVGQTLVNALAYVTGFNIADPTFISSEYQHYVTSGYNLSANKLALAIAQAAIHKEVMAETGINWKNPIPKKKDFVIVMTHFTCSTCDELVANTPANMMYCGPYCDDCLSKHKGECARCASNAAAMAA